MMSSRVVTGIIITACLMIEFSTVYAGEDGVIRLPADWYTLPEDSDAPNDPTYNLQPVPEETSRALDVTLRTHADTWDEIATANQLGSLAPDVQGNKPWHLEFLAADLGVSLQGALGVLFLKGSALMNLYWRRHHETPPPAPATIDTPEESDADLALSEGVEPGELEKRIEPIIRSVMATGRVHNERNFRNNLWEKALRFDVMSYVLTLQSAHAWQPVRLRLDLQVDASGTVATGVTVGGGVKIRFDWFPTAKKHGATPAWMKSPEMAKMAYDFERFLRPLMREVEQAKFDPSATPAHMPLRLLSFSLGISISGKFGLASAGAALTGMLYLQPRVNADVPAKPPQDTDPLLLVGGEPSERVLHYAKDHNITLVREQGAASSSTLYFLPTDGFQKGMQRAYKMGSFFAERAKANQGKKFDIDQLRTQFALSIGGTAGVVTVAGTAAIQLVFQRDNFYQEAM